MIESWRWFGPLDKISLDHIAQSGAGILVSALHEIPYGEIWDEAAIQSRQALIARADRPLSWQVVESLPLHENIKKGEGDLPRIFANYRQSMVNLAACGIKTICYNFMPVLDWTRTTLDWQMPSGGHALRYSAVEMAAFDMFILQRPGAEDDHAKQVISQAQLWFEKADMADKDRLLASIMTGLPGAYDRYDVAGLRAALQAYEGLTHKDLRANLKRFLQEIIPTAQELGVNMCIHPDDPPWDILGLPRIVSTQSDIAWILEAVQAHENGVTFCTGGFGAHPKNDVIAMARAFAQHVHFAHLRNVTKSPDGSFHESNHLGGDVDLVQVMEILQSETHRRHAEEQGRPIYFRPDHGHALAGDKGAGTHPGYPYIGRLKGLAELRGVLAALNAASV